MCHIDISLEARLSTLVVGENALHLGTMKLRNRVEYRLALNTTAAALKRRRRLVMQSVNLLDKVISAFTITLDTHL